MKLKFEEWPAAVQVALGFILWWLVIGGAVALLYAVAPDFAASLGE